MSRMHNPPHPGEVIKELCLDPLELTVTAAAEGLGVSRRTLSALLNGHAGISPDMAIRLSKAFGRSPESWLQLQLQYDLWQAEQRSGTIKVKQFAVPTPCSHVRFQGFGRNYSFPLQRKRSAQRCAQPETGPEDAG
jgi:addiction module HigA family antidote